VPILTFDVARQRPEVRILSHITAGSRQTMQNVWRQVLPQRHEYEAPMTSRKDAAAEHEARLRSKLSLERERAAVQVEIDRLVTAVAGGGMQTGLLDGLQAARDDERTLIGR